VYKELRVRENMGEKTDARDRRKYYENNNFLISQYLYIDRLLDSSLPRNLVQEYDLDIPPTVSEEHSPNSTPNNTEPTTPNGISRASSRLKRNPKDLYRIPDEETPLIQDNDVRSTTHPHPHDIQAPEDDTADSQDRIVTIAIYINLLANFTLLLGKIAVIYLTSSLSVLASLVDAALDFLSTAIVWITTKLISRQDSHRYPVGRRRLEPIGVLVFSVVMITAFCQVALQCIKTLAGSDHSIVELSNSAIIIMLLTIIIKFACWLWCRLIKNSSVQALAQDAVTDIIFNTFSIIFPLGTYLPPSLPPRS
jgi:hypothetical protein